MGSNEVRPTPRNAFSLFDVTQVAQVALSLARNSHCRLKPRMREC
jgi:hypothetical protein